MTNVVIVAAGRTAVGSFNGSFANTPAHELGAAVLELTGRTGESPWFDFLNQLRRELPVVQKQAYQLADGTVTDQLTEEQAAKIAKWRQWSYYKLMYKEID